MRNNWRSGWKSGWGNGWNKSIWKKTLSLAVALSVAFSAIQLPPVHAAEQTEPGGLEKIGDVLLGEPVEYVPELTQTENHTDLTGQEPYGNAGAGQAAYDTAAVQETGSTGLNVVYRTQEEIRAFLTQSGALSSDAVTYGETPSVVSPYSAGSLSQETLTSAVAMLNQVRYIAGLSYDVTLNEEYNKQVQAAALVNYVNAELSHYPAQPSDMPDELYRLGVQGAGSANIAWASWEGRPLNTTITCGWMADEDDYNISTLGHRRWILNPYMKQTGFGAVMGERGIYSAMYAHDNFSLSTDISGVAWPAQNMPADYFAEDYPWSVSTGNKEDISAIQVTLTRMSDGKVWNFSEASSDGYFNVDNGGYGQYGCIIFRPELPSDAKAYMDGDSYHVEITKDGAAYISYDVNFFSLIQTFQITYELNGGENNSRNPEIYSSDSDTIVLQDPVKTGYTFDGWYRDSAFTERITEIAKGSTGDLTLYAKWIAGTGGSGGDEGGSGGDEGGLGGDEGGSTGDGGDSGGNTGSCKGLGAVYRTPIEIADFFAESGERPGGLAPSYQDMPSLTAPYSAGSLSQETLESAVTLLNQIRYMAGIPYNVTLNETYNEQAQAAALLGAVNGEASHTPVQPAGMSDELYRLGAAGAGDSNLSKHQYNNSLNQTLVYEWLASDSNQADRATVERRRWLLNPTMKQTGFGAVKNEADGYNYYSMYVKDGAADSTDIQGVAWPARSTPLEYFKIGHPWSVSVGEYVDISAIQVNLTRLEDGKVWSFSQESADGEFYVDNGAYGQAGCIIFLPTPTDIKTYEHGDSYHVEITRDGEEYISYDVYFFSLAKVNAHEGEYKIAYELNGGQNNSKNPDSFRAAEGAALYEPTREGYVFGGWFMKGDLTRPITEIPKGTKWHVTLYARWGYPDPTGNSKGVHSAYRTQEEIAAYMKQSGITREDKVVYKEKPSTKAPYRAGSLTRETLESAVAMLNQVRYIAGVPNGVTLNDEYNEMCQAAALVNDVNGGLSHDPKQPHDMPKELYDLGHEGASHSNLGMGYDTLNEDIVDGWAGDHGESNRESVGHRRWVLNPAMKQTGFGAVEWHYAMYALDNASNDITEDAGYGVVWPARNMPAEYFTPEFPWSVSMGERLEDTSAFQVTLTRRADGKEWKFSEASSDGYFNVNNEGYGQYGCIIFWPERGEIESYEAGDVYHVEITRNGEEYVTYDVNFFSPDDVDTDIDTNVYQIKYELNGGQNNSQNPESYTFASETIVLQAPTREGYLFGGWFRDRKFKNQVTEIPAGSKGDLILYAKWISEGGGASNDGDDAGGLHVALPEGSVYTYTGKAIKPAISVKQGERVLTAGVDYTVKYSNNVKASVKAAANKQPRITVTGKGNYSGSDSVEFTIQPKSLNNQDSGVNDTVDLVCPETLYVTVGSKIALTLFYGSLKLGTKDYYLSTDADSEVRPGKANEGDNGIIYVTAKPGGNYTGQIAVRVTGVEKGSLKKISVIPNKNFKPVYNGKEQRPVFGGAGSGADVEVTAKDAPSELTEGVDYYVTYLTDTTNAGTVKYRVVGLGLYTGSVTKSYKISPIRADAEDMKLGGSLTGDHPYHSKGASISDLTVTYNGGSTTAGIRLTEGKDYKVTYSQNKKVGTGKFTVTFLGNFKGSKALKNNTFNIVPAKWEKLGGAKVIIPDMIYKKSGIYKSAPVVSLDGAILKKTDYRVDYYYFDAEGNRKTMDGGNKLTLEDGGTAVTVYAEITGKGNYSADSFITGSYQVRRLSEKEVDLSRAKVTFYDENGVKNKMSYTGGPVEPDRIEVTCKVNGATVELLEDQDYTVSYAGNKSKGKVTVILTGTGMRNASGVMFVGSKKAFFNITAMKVTGKITFDNVGKTGTALLEFIKELAD